MEHTGCQYRTHSAQYISVAWLDSFSWTRDMDARHLFSSQCLVVTQTLAGLYLSSNNCCCLPGTYHTYFTRLEQLEWMVTSHWAPFWCQLFHICFVLQPSGDPHWDQAGQQSAGGAPAHSGEKNCKARITQDESYLVYDSLLHIPPTYSPVNVTYSMCSRRVWAMKGSTC